MEERISKEMRKEKNSLDRKTEISPKGGLHSQNVIQARMR